MGTTTSETPDAPAEPKRLSGLWIVCVLLGLLGMYLLALVLIATPLGMALFGAMGVAYLVAAVGLWRRHWWAWVLGLALVVVRLAFQSAQALGDWPASAGMMAIPVAVSLAVLAYLWLRRRHFAADAPRAAFRTARGVVAALIVVSFGVLLALWTVVDEPRREFPELAVDLAPPPAAENAFFIIEEMGAAAPDDDYDEYLWLTENAPGKVDPVPEDWAARAEAYLKTHAPDPDRLEEALARPWFSDPDMPLGAEGFEHLHPWLAFGRQAARLLALSSELHLWRGESEAALEDADRCVRLGLLYARRPDGTIPHLVGLAICHIGLAQVRRVFETTEDAMLLGQYTPPEGAEQDLAAGLRRALAVEFRQFDALTDDLHRMRSPAPLENGPVGANHWRPALISRMPMIKPNMTHNMRGEQYADIVAQIGRLDRPPADTPPHRVADSFMGMGELLREVGWLHFVRNPVGSILTHMAEPSLRSVESKVTAIAELRLTRLHRALRIYHLEQGELPETLDALVPDYMDEVPLDPFTHEAFLYEREAEPPLLRSVGPDQVPGLPREEGGDDVVIELRFAAGE